MFFQDREGKKSKYIFPNSSIESKGGEVPLPFVVLLTEGKEAETMILYLECIGNLCLRLKISSFVIPIC